MQWLRENVGPLDAAAAAAEDGASVEQGASEGEEAEEGALDRLRLKVGALTRVIRGH